MSKLWCVHLIGPDDVIAYPDQQSAEREATLINEALERRAVAHKGNANWPTPRAVAKIWPWSAEAHAADLAENIREMECKGDA